MATTTFTDDASIPYATSLYYSNKKLVSSTIALYICLIICIIFTAICAHDNNIVLFMLAFMGFVLHRLYDTYKKKKVTAPVIILSNDGIEAKGSFLSWENISYEKINEIGEIDFLEFYHYYDGKRIKKILISIDELATNAKSMQHLLKIYRGRYIMHKI